MRESGTGTIDYGLAFGVDVSKRTLDVCRPDGTPAAYANDGKGCEALAAEARRAGGSVWVESTGGYDLGIVLAARAAGVPAGRVNPYRVRHYAIASGIMEKTDRIDAALIREFAAAMRPAPEGPGLEARVELAACHSVLMALKEKRAGVGSMAEHAARSPAAARSVAAVVKALDREIGRLEEECLRIIREDEAQARLLDRMCSVIGIGETTAVTVIAETPALGAMSDKEAAGFYGLEPARNQSGASCQKPSHIRGGDFRARKALYMPAVACSRHNPIFRDFYQRLVAKGKPKKVALTAVMRKIIVLLNRIAREPGFVPLAAGTKKAARKAA